MKLRNFFRATVFGLVVLGMGCLFLAHPSPTLAGAYLSGHTFTELEGRTVYLSGVDVRWEVLGGQISWDTPCVRWLGEGKEYVKEGNLWVTQSGTCRPEQCPPDASRPPGWNCPDGCFSGPANDAYCAKRTCYFHAGHGLWRCRCDINSAGWYRVTETGERASTFFCPGREPFCAGLDNGSSENCSLGDGVCGERGGFVFSQLFGFGSVYQNLKVVPSFPDDYVGIVDPANGHWEYVGPPYEGWYKDASGRWVYGRLWEWKESEQALYMYGVLSDNEEFGDVDFKWVSEGSQEFTRTEVGVSPAEITCGRESQISPVTRRDSDGQTLSVWDDLLYTCPPGGGSCSYNDAGGPEQIRSGESGAWAPTTLGRYTVTADFSGNQDYASSQSGPAALQVNCAPTRLSLTLTPSVGMVGFPVAGGVVVSGGLFVQDAGNPLDGQPIGGAAVTISIDAVPWRTVATSSEGAFAERWDAPSLSVGDYTFTAHYAGSDCYCSANGQQAFSVRDVPAWFQTEAGDVFASNHRSAPGLSIISEIPTDPLSFRDEDQFLAKPCFSAENADPGVMLGAAAGFNFGQGDASCVSDKMWEAADYELGFYNIGSSRRYLYDFSYFEDNLEPDCSVGSDAVAAGGVVSNGSDACAVGSFDVIKVVGDLTVRGADGFDGKRAVILVDGDVTFTADFAPASGAYAFLSGGMGGMIDLSRVANVRALLLADGSIASGTDQDGSGLLVSGSAIGFGYAPGTSRDPQASSFFLKRKRLEAARPAEYFSYDTALFLELEEILGDSRYTWKEVE